jgi:hypothetical protein
MRLMTTAIAVAAVALAGCGGDSPQGFASNVPAAASAASSATAPSRIPARLLSTADDDHGETWKSDRAHPARKSRMSSATVSGWSSRKRWPPPRTTRKRALGIRRAMSRELASGTIGSSSPATIRVGW